MKSAPYGDRLARAGQGDRPRAGGRLLDDRQSLARARPARRPSAWTDAPASSTWTLSPCEVIAGLAAVPVSSLSGWTVERRQEAGQRAVRRFGCRVLRRREPAAGDADGARRRDERRQDAPPAPGQ